MCRLGGGVAAEGGGIAAEGGGVAAEGGGVAAEGGGVAAELSILYFLGITRVHCFARGISTLGYRSRHKLRGC